MPPAIVTGVPVGEAWQRLAVDVAAAIPRAEVDAVWEFRALRRGQKEFGTAVVARVDGERRDRLRIYTARYVHTIKGKERGRFECALEEVGQGPLDALAQLLAGVQRRMDDEVPTPVDPAAWFKGADDGTPRQG